jgi:2-iminoacetate synthase
MNEHEEDASQFCLNDARTSGEIIHDVIKMGHVPSFCTGCYRKERVGADFMDLAKPGLIKLHCLPNGLTTLKEYLGEALIEKEIMNIPAENVRERTREFLGKIEKGERDLYF